MNTINVLFDWMLTAGLRASLLVLVVLGAQWFLKNRLPSRWRYALWLPVLAALLLPALPVLPSWMQWPEARVSKQVPSPVAAVAVPTSGLPERVLVPSLRDPEERENVPAPSSVPPTIKPVTPDAPESGAVRAWLCGTWLAGAAAAVLIVMASFARTMRRIRTASLPVDGDLLSQIGGTARQVGLRLMPRVLKSPAVSSPAVCGLWRPVLLLNDRFPQDFSAEEADMVLRHELTHIRRGDLPLNALLCALLALHWWNPLLWFAFLRARADREAACDAQVLNGATAARRAAYGHTLLKLEAGFPPSGLCLGFVGIIQRGGTLRGRISAIISQPQLNPAMKTATLLMIALLTAAGIATATDEEKPANPPETKAAAAKPMKVEPSVMLDPMVKSHFAGMRLMPPQMERALNRKYAVTEYEIEGLWETMGVQLFVLRDDQESDLSYFAFANGELTPLGVFTFGGTGIGGAVVSGGALYFKYGAGSGIHRVNLYKVSQGKNNTLTSESLGVIERDPEDTEGRQFAEKMRDVIAKLKPVKKGQSTALAAAPKIETPKKVDAASVFEPMVKMFLAELPDAEKGAFAKAEFSAAELLIENLWDVTGTQIFELTSGPDSAHEIFTLQSGELKKLPILSDHGYPTAVVDLSSVVVYFTSHSGSGITATTLHKLSLTGELRFTHEELGIIAANPAENADADLVKKMQDVIATLKPVKKGAATRPAPAKTGAEAAPSRAVDPEQINGRISVKRGGEITATLKADGEQLLPAAPGEKANPDDITVRIAIQETTATPFPVSGDATRPFLAVSHNSQKSLRFRALARLKGSREFREIDGQLEPVDSGEAMTAVHCWESGAALEEVILYQFTTAPGTGAGEPAAAVTRQTGKDGTSFYHLRYVLTPENCELSVSNQQRPPRYSGSNAYTFEQGGQFEVFIRASAFPVPVETPDQQPGFMILRMPSTNTDELKADQRIAGKRSLFDRIRQMKTEGRGSVEVVIQLDNVEVLTEQPLSVEMRGINVYFRQAFGRYIDYTGPLKKEDRGE